MFDAASGQLGVPRLHPKHLQKVILEEIATRALCSSQTHVT
jgi:hypothetical protein